MKKCFFTRLFSIILSVTSGAVFAENGTWNQPVGGNWLNEANWVGGSIPSAGTAEFPKYTAPEAIAVINDAVSLSLTGVTINGNYQFTGNAPALRGSVTVAADATAAFRSGVRPVSGGELTFGGAGTSVLGGNMTETFAESTLIVKKGTVRIAPDANYTLSSSLLGRLQLQIKDGGRLEIGTNATVSAAGFFLAQSGVAEVIVDGGRLRLTGSSSSTASVTAAGDGDTAQAFLTVRNGGRIDSDSGMNLGIHGATTVTLDNGTLATRSLSFSNGSEGSNPARAKFTKMTLRNGSMLSVPLGYFCWKNRATRERTNTVEVLSGSRFAVMPTIPGSAPYASSPENFGTACLYVNDGTLAAVSTQTVNYYAGLDRLFIGEGGITFDCNFGMTVTQALLPDPAMTNSSSPRLTKRGTAQLKLMDTSMHAPRHWILEEGTLSLVNEGSDVLALDTFTFIGGTLALDVSDLISVSGSLTLASGTCLSVTAPNTVTGGSYPLLRYTLNTPHPDRANLSLAYTGPGTAALVLDKGAREVRVVITLPSADPDAEGPVPTAIWTAPGSGAWNDAANWSVVPGLSDLAGFGSAAETDTTVTLGASRAVAGINVAQGPSLTFDGEPLILVGGVRSVVKAPTTFADKLTVSGDVQFRNESTLNLGSVDGVGALSVSGGVLNVTGPMTAAGGLSLAGDVRASLPTAGSFPLNTGTSRVSFVSGPAAVSGKWTVSGRTRVTAPAGGLALNNEITFSGSLGSLLFEGDGTNYFNGTTSYSVSNESGILLTKGTLIFGPGASFSMATGKRNALAVCAWTKDDKAVILIPAGASLAIPGMWLGNNDSHGTDLTFTLDGGTIICNGSESTIANTVNDKVLIEVKDGLFRTETGFVSIGVQGQAVIEQTGGRMELNAVAIQGYQNTTLSSRIGSGELRILGGTCQIFGVLAFNTTSSASGRGTLILGNGTPFDAELSTKPAMRIAGSRGTASVILNGGLLTLVSESAARNADIFAGVDSVTAGPGGAVINTQDADFALTQNLAGEGGVVKLGEGTLTLAGGADTFAGPIAVSNGTLVVAGANAFSGVLLEPGSTLSLPSLPEFSLSVFRVPSGATLRLTALRSSPARAFPDDLLLAGVLELPSVTPGVYTLGAFNGNLSAVSSVRLILPGGIDAAFSISDGQLLLTVTTTAGVTVWTNTAGGLWSDVQNWSLAVPNVSVPALLSDTVTSLTSPITITAAAGAAAKILTLDSAASVTLNGAPVAFGEIDTRKGLHTFAGPLSSVVNTLTLNGDPDGASSVTVVLPADTDDPFNASAVAFNDFRLGISGGVPEQVLKSALTVEGSAARLMPQAGLHVTLSAVPSGAGTFGNAGEGRMTVPGALPGNVAAELGTLDVTGFAPGADLFIRSGTLRNMSTEPSTVGGLTSGDVTDGRVPWLETAGDLTLTRAADLPYGLVKTGTGTVFFAAAANRSSLFQEEHPYGPVSLSPLGGGLHSEGLMISQGRAVFPAGSYTNDLKSIAVGFLTDGVTVSADDEVVAELDFLGGTTVNETGIYMTLGRGLTRGVSRLLVDGASVTQPNVSCGNTFTDTPCPNRAEMIVRNGGTLRFGYANLAERPGTATDIRIDGGVLTIDGLMRTGHASGQSEIGGATSVTVENGGIFRVGTLQAGAAGASHTEVTVHGADSRMELGAVIPPVSPARGSCFIDGGTLAFVSNNTFSAVTLAGGAGGLTLEAADGVVARIEADIVRADGVLSDAGIVKAGAGRIVLAGSAPLGMRGPVRVAAGMLETGPAADFSLASGVTVASGATFSLPQNVIVTQRLASLTCEDGAVLRLFVDGTWIGCGALAVEGTPILGNTVVELCGLSVETLFRLPLVGVTFPILTYTGEPPDISGLSFRAGTGVHCDFAVDTENHAVVMTMNPDRSTELGFVWTKIGDGTWSTDANWNTDRAPLNEPAMDVLFPNSQSDSVQITLDSPVTVGALRFTSARQYAIAKSGNGKIIFDNNGVASRLTSEKGLYDANRDKNIISAPIELSGQLNVIPTRSSPISLSDSVTGTKDAAMVMTGPGSLFLSMSDLGVPITVDTQEGTVHSYMTGTAKALTLRQGNYSVRRPHSIGDVHLPVSPSSARLLAEYTLTVNGTVSGDGSLQLYGDAGTGTVVLTKSSAYTGETRVITSMGNMPRLALRAPGTFGSGRVTCSGGKLGAVGTDPVRVSNEIYLGSDLFAASDRDAEFIIDGSVTAVTNKGIVVCGPGTLGLDTSVKMNAFTHTVRIEDGVLRLLPYAELDLVSETFPTDAAATADVLRSQIKAVTYQVGNNIDLKRSTGLAVETNALLRAYGIFVPSASDFSDTKTLVDDERMNRFNLTLDGGTIELTAPSDCLNLGDVSGTVIRVDCKSGLFKIPSTAWAYIGARSPVIFTQTGGLVDFGNFSMGRGEVQGENRFGGQTEVFVFDGTFRVGSRFCWLAGTSPRTNRFVIGNGPSSTARAEIPPTYAFFQYNTKKIQTIMTFNGGTLAFHNSTVPNYSLTDALRGATRVEADVGGVCIEVGAGLVATISQPIVPAETENAGAAPLVKTGSGSLVLPDSGSFTGRIDVCEGLLRTAPAAGRDWHVAEGAVLDLAGASGTNCPACLSGAGVITNGLVTLGSGALLVAGEKDAMNTSGGALSLDALRIEAGSRLLLPPGQAVARAESLSVSGSGLLSFGFTADDPMPLPYTAEVLRFGTLDGSFRAWRVTDPVATDRSVFTTFTVDDGIVRVTVDLAKGSLLIVR